MTNALRSVNNSMEKQNTPSVENAQEQPQMQSVGSVALLAGIVDRCQQADVGKVYAAIHHGMHFLLADDGPNANGICYRDDTMSCAELATLAAQVNAALSANKHIS